MTRNKERPYNKTLFVCALALVVIASVQIVITDSFHMRVLAVVVLVLNAVLAIAAWFEKNTAGRPKSDD